jgi:alpha-N-arabinofuranosidase
MVDEWGVWHNVEPGTNPGFLYQQNTIRDALVAAISLNIFNQHADRVKMANIAQTINVLQAMILTDKEKMLVTPTYHVFEMYTVHHNAKLVPAEVKGASYELGQQTVPMISLSASREENGAVNVTFCNLDPNREAAVECALQGFTVQALSGRVLTSSSLTAHNTFAQPETVKPAPFEAFAKSAAGFTVTLPPKSVVLVTAK